MLERCEAKLSKELDIVQFVMRFRECRTILASKIKAGKHSKFLNQARQPIVSSNGDSESVSVDVPINDS